MQSSFPQHLSHFGRGVIFEPIPTREYDSGGSKNGPPGNWLKMSRKAGLQLCQLLCLELRSFYAFRLLLFSLVKYLILPVFFAGDYKNVGKQGNQGTKQGRKPRTSKGRKGRKRLKERSCFVNTKRNGTFPLCIFHDPLWPYFPLEEGSRKERGRSGRRGL